MTLTVQQAAPGQPWTLEECTFVNDQSLSLWYQSLVWLFYAYCVPLFVFFFLVQMVDFKDELSLMLGALGFVLFLPCCVIWSGVAAYFLFDSALAVLLCIVAYIALTVGLITFIVKSRWGGAALVVLWILHHFAPLG